MSRRFPSHDWRKAPNGEAIKRHFRLAPRCPRYLPLTIVAFGLCTLLSADPGRAGTPEDALSPDNRRVGYGGLQSRGKPHADTRTGVAHVIVALQTGHSYDNYFGAYPEGENLPPGTCVPSAKRAGAACVRPFHLLSEALLIGGLSDSRLTFRRSYAHGKLTGFVSAIARLNQRGRAAMGYYTGADLPYYWSLAKHYTLFDHFFGPSPGGAAASRRAWVGPEVLLSLLNHHVTIRLYLQGFERGPGGTREEITRVPELWLRPVLRRYPKLLGTVAPLSEYYAAAANGKLPNIAFILSSGPTEHAPTSLISGQAFIHGVFTALSLSEQWSSSVMLLSYSDWGGFYDHVRPPRLHGRQVGYRVPALLLGARVRDGSIVSTPATAADVRRFIMWNWFLSGARSPGAIHEALTSSARPRSASLLPLRTRTAPPASAETGLIFGLYGAAMFAAAVITATALLTQRGRR
jgi:phospholipase C